MIGHLKFTLDAWSIVLLFASLHGLFLSFVLLSHKRGNRRSNRFLSLLSVSVSLILAEYIMISSGFYSNFRYVEFLTNPLFFLTGPLFYFYVRSLLVRESRPHPYLRHCIPAILAFVNALPYYLFVAGTVLGSDRVGGSSFLPINGYLYMALYIVQTSIYIAHAYRLLQKYEKAAKTNFSQTTISLFGWLRHLSLVMIAFLLGQLLAFVLLMLTTHIVEIEYLMAVTWASIVYTIGYHAMREPEVIVGAGSVESAEKYQRSALTPEQSRLHLAELKQLMENESPHLQPDLKLHDLANRLSISPNHLSQVLNQELHTNFFDFVNSYRINEVKQRMTNPAFSHLTLLAIALESGFSSKTSFNRIFKKVTGTTPSSFVRTQRTPSRMLPSNAPELS